MTSSPRSRPDRLDDLLVSANALVAIAARSVIEVENTVTSPQLRVLVFLATQGTQNLSTIADELHVHPSNATRTCDKLLKAGLIGRSADPDDRRYVRLELAPAGRDLVSDVLTSRRSALKAIMDTIPPESRRQVEEAFAIFAEAAGAAHPDGRFIFHLDPQGTDDTN